MAGERNWDDEFREMIGFGGPFGDDSEDPSLEDILYEGLSRQDLTRMIIRREEMNYVQHQVLVNSFQARTFMYGMIGFTFATSILMSVAWTIWYWIK